MMKRNIFNLSHQHNTTMNLGFIIPIMCVEVLPGDSMRRRASIFLRAFPTDFPVMQPVHIETRDFFVPNRLIWDDFEKFIIGEDITWPHINFDAVAEETLANYLGLPAYSYAQSGISCNALPFRAYNLIFNEYFRDEQLTSEVPISKGNGTDSTTGETLLRAAWKKDRFNSARPNPQLGDAVPINISTTIAPDGPLVLSAENGAYAKQVVSMDDGGGGSPQRTYKSTLDEAGVQAFDAYYASGLQGSDVTLTVEDIRNSLALQRFQEQLNRTGGRYTEYLRQLGVRSPDARLDRPEYLGGGHQRVSWSEVLQTAPAGTGQSIGVGNYKGHGIAGMRSNRWQRYFTEHGIVLSLAIIRPTSQYSQGADRMWFRDTYDQYYQKQLQHLGMEPVYVGEIDMKNATDHRKIFGYQDRYDEYRHKAGYCSGKMTNASYEGFHFSRTFPAEPTLNNSFIECIPPTSPWAVASQPHFFAQVTNSLRARRLLPKVANPRTF